MSSNNAVAYKCHTCSQAFVSVFFFSKPEGRQQISMACSVLNVMVHRAFT